MQRYFTVEEANTMLTTLRPRVARMLELRREILDRREAVLDALQAADGGDAGGRLLTEMVFRFERMERVVEAIQATGAELKDINVGLLDFRSWRDGREVYLCWRYGEPEIEYWHELDGGFAGRQRLEE